MLAGAAIAASEDPLYGLKENVIIGKLIPAGTGFVPGRFSGGAGNRSQIQSDELGQSLSSLAVSSEQGTSWPETGEPSFWSEANENPLLDD